MSWKMTAIILGVAIATIAVFMEVYKKIFRKDKAKAGEIHALAIGLSLFVSVFAFKGFDFQGNWWSVPLYAFAVYSIQYFVNMELIKALVKWYIKKKGIVLEGYKHNE